MSGIEILGVAAGVLQIAELGGKLSVKLFTFSRKVKNAHNSISSISKDIAATGAVLQQLSRVLKKDEQLRLCSDEAIETAKSLVTECRKIFSELDEALDSRPSSNKYISSLKDRLKYPFLEPHIDLLQSNLERLKSSLVVILNVLIFAEQLRSQEALPILQEQRTLIKILIEDRNTSCTEFEQKQKAIEHGSVSTKESSAGEPPTTCHSTLPDTLSPFQISAFSRDQEIEHHGNLVENLMEEISDRKHRVNHGIRFRMHQCVLRTHWDEWSPLRRLYGDARLMRTISRNAELARYWLSEMEAEAIVGLSHSPNIKPPSYTPRTEQRPHASDSKTPVFSVETNPDLSVPVERYGKWDNRVSFLPPPPPPRPPLVPLPKDLNDTQRQSAPGDRHLQDRRNTKDTKNSSFEGTASTTVIDFDRPRLSIAEDEEIDHSIYPVPQTQPDYGPDLEFKEANAPCAASLRPDEDDSDDESDDGLFSLPLAVKSKPENLSLASLDHRPGLSNTIESKPTVAFRRGASFGDPSLPCDGNFDLSNSGVTLRELAQSSKHRRTFFRSTTWASRPPARTILERLDEYFPKHVLDRPCFAERNASSPQLPESTIDSVSDASKPIAHDHGGLASPARQDEGYEFLGTFKSIREVVQGYVSEDKLKSQAKLEIIRGQHIGKGTYGSVCLGMNVANGQILAVKQIEVTKNAAEKDQKRIHEAITALNYLKHSNIVQYLDYEQHDLSIDIYLEYVPGGSIGSCLRSHGKMEESIIRSLTSQTLKGLSYLHNEGIISANLKADNILLTLDGLCKISDFSIAKKLADILTTDYGNSVTGPVFWLAPEAVRAQGQGSTKADIWSLGCVVLEMFTAKRPWSREEAIGAIFQLGSLNQAPPIPEDVQKTASIEALSFMYDCFTVNPDDRPRADFLQHSPFCENDSTFDWYKTNLFTRIRTERYKHQTDPRHTSESAQAPIRGRKSVSEHPDSDALVSDAGRFSPTNTTPCGEGSQMSNDPQPIKKSYFEVNRDTPADRDGSIGGISELACSSSKQQALKKARAKGADKMRRRGGIGDPARTMSPAFGWRDRDFDNSVDVSEQKFIEDDINALLMQWTTLDATEVKRSIRSADE